MISNNISFLKAKEPNTLTHERRPQKAFFPRKPFWRWIEEQIMVAEDEWKVPHSSSIMYGLLLRLLERKCPSTWIHYILVIWQLSMSYNFSELYIKLSIQAFISIILLIALITKDFLKPISSSNIELLLFCENWRLNQS